MDMELWFDEADVCEVQEGINEAWTVCARVGGCGVIIQWREWLGRKRVTERVDDAAYEKGDGRCGRGDGASGYPKSCRPRNY